MNVRGGQSHRGFTLFELLLVLAIAGVLLSAVGGLIGSALRTQTTVRERNDLTRQARFAMGRMVAAVRDTGRLMIPLAENPATAWSESLRDPGVLAVTLDPTIDRDADGFADADKTLDPTIDRDADGFADADNDKDGRIDEDLPGDNNKDFAPGIVGIDDDGDGVADEGGEPNDNDEDGTPTEDSLDGVDNDGDGAVDEDISSDNNKDFAPGIEGVDDDQDGQIDETPNSNNDEDGSIADDWLDPVVYFLNGTDLVERMPNLNPVDGTDYTESVVAENVTSFIVERVPGARAVLVAITLELTGPSGESTTLSTKVCVGGGP
jgi:prepilin-type N-terminal cleavage/methylation domain-containing protein